VVADNSIVLVMLEGKRTKLFWIGLIIWVVASLYLYSVLWTLSQFFNMALGFMASSFIPTIAVSLVFIVIGLLMIKMGIKKSA